MDQFDPVFEAAATLAKQVKLCAVDPVLRLLESSLMANSAPAACDDHEDKLGVDPVLRMAESSLSRSGEALSTTVRNVGRRARRKALREGAKPMGVGRPIVHDTLTHQTRRRKNKVRRTVKKLQQIGVEGEDLANALNCKAGQRAGFVTPEREDKCKKALRSFTAALPPNSAIKRSFVRTAKDASGMGAKEFAVTTGLKPELVRQYSQPSKRFDVQKHDPLSSSYPPGVTRVKLKVEEMLTDMYWIKQFVFKAFSGAKTGTFKLIYMKQTVYHRYIQSQAWRVRKLYTDYPDLRASPERRAKGRLTVLEKNIEAVLAQNLGLKPATVPEVSGKLDFDTATLTQLMHRARCLGLKKEGITWRKLCNTEGRVTAPILATVIRSFTEGSDHGSDGDSAAEADGDCDALVPE